MNPDKLQKITIALMIATIIATVTIRTIQPSSGDPIPPPYPSLPT